MGLQLRTKRGGCPILAVFARACPEVAEGVGGDAQLWWLLQFEGQAHPPKWRAIRTGCLVS